MSGTHSYAFCGIIVAKLPPKPYFLAMSLQTLPFALSFVHFTPSFDEFQNGQNKDYLGSDFLVYPNRSYRIRFENGPKKDYLGFNLK